MQNYITHFITGSENLKTILDQLDNDPLVGDYSYEIKSQGETDDGTIVSWSYLVTIKPSIQNKY